MSIGFNFFDFKAGIRPERMAAKKAIRTVAVIYSQR